MSNSILDYDFSTLSRDQRLELIRKVWVSLQQEPAGELSEELKTLLESRFCEMEEHPENTLSWDEFHQQAFKPS
jgi:putative addiction module component (TIGR02574 family)